MAPDLVLPSTPSPAPAPSPIADPEASDLPSSEASLGSLGLAPQVVFSSIAVYSDLGCTNPQPSISWGQLAPGATQTVTLYVRNEGSQPVTLSEALTNLNPTSLSGYFVLSWDYANQPVLPLGVQAVRLSLTVLANVPAVSSFSFDTVITGTSG